jgi:hypothetical protein
VTVIYAFVVMFMNVEAEKILLDGLRIIMYLFFSFSIALATAVLSNKTLAAWLRFAIHYVLCAFGFFLFILLPIENANDGFLVVGMVIFTVIYAIAAACVSFFGARYKRIKEETEDYKKHFSK